MSKKFTRGLVFLAALLVGGNAIAAQNNSGVGLGLIVGDPTGLSLKAWMGRTNAVDAALSWSDHGDERFRTHVDYLWHDFSAFPVKQGRLPLYYGVGASIIEDDYYHYHNGGYHYHGDTHVGVRVPVGISYLFATNPLELFAELGPRMDVTPDTDFTIDAAFGLRFYFK